MLEDVVLTENPEEDTKKDKEEEEKQIPKYLSRIENSQMDEKWVTTQFFDEFKAIKKEREESCDVRGRSLEGKWDELDAQYETQIEEIPEQQFSIHNGLTKGEVDKVVNRILQAYLEIQPLYAVTPRPQFQREGGKQVAEHQEDFLDYSFDEVIPYRPPKEKTIRSAVLKGNGIGKWDHEIIRDPRRREEVYEGNPRPKIVMDQETGEQVQIIENKELERFLKNYPTALEDNKGMVKKISEGKKVSILAEGMETLYDDPMPTYVDLKNFYVRTATKGNWGLATTRLIVERINYNWWELQKLKNQPEYFDDAIDKMMFKSKDDAGKDVKIPGYENEKYDVLVGTFRTKLNEGDKEEIKAIFYFAEDMEIMIGAVYDKFYAIRCQYVDHHIVNVNPGFYQPGLGEILTDDNITIDALINNLIESLYTQNLITPVVKENTSTEMQFLERRGIHGFPIVTPDGKPLQFFNQFMRPPDIAGFLAAMNFLRASAQDKTGGNDAFGGNLDPIDPNEPGNKFIARLQESNINIKVYIMSLLESFNLDAQIVLGIYYQISEEGRKFSNKRTQSKVTGELIFSEITRDEMIARTNIKSQAFTFAIEKQIELQNNMFVYDLIRQEPLVIADPEQVYELIRDTVKSVSPEWRIRIDKVLSTPEELKKKMIQTAMLGTAAYVQQLIQAGQQGQTPPIDPNQLLQVVSVFEKELATPPSEDEVREREKSQKESEKQNA